MYTNLPTYPPTILQTYMPTYHPTYLPTSYFPHIIWNPYLPPMDYKLPTYLPFYLPSIMQPTY